MDNLKTGWWTSKTTGGKWAIGITAVGVIAGITALVMKYTKKEEVPTKKETEEKLRAAIENVKDKIEVQNLTLDIALPNKGEGCSVIQTNYDNDFDYVKCKNVWFTKSKANAKSPANRDKYKDWFSLESNAVATDRLNRRYPN